ncbi:hypothetical protein V500_03063 [Pseudogymnoascus sp. VKM F-4518 (FW-2643)]|nr:hypothetical protein V500_03063 [Pseudogymnoascus sp. VKM F-4518 (FW-2643)]
MSSENGDAQFVQTNIAIWVLTCASAAFLFVRLWCRVQFSRLGWDDYVLTTSWVILLVSCALMSRSTLLSRSITAGDTTDDVQRSFYRFQNTSTAMTTIATSWAKVAFAITLTRIVRNRVQTYFLWAIIATANIILIPGMLSIWIPACGDPRAKYRPAHTMCLPLLDLQYLGGTTIVYGGVIDILLALLPWVVIRKLQLVTREKIGLTFAMSLGAVTGTIVIFRAFYQFKSTDNNYHFMIFMSIFNFLEPAVTIIAQAIPMFRVLVVGVKRATQTSVRITSLTSRHKLVVAKSNSLEKRTGDSKNHGHPNQDHELLHFRTDVEAAGWGGTVGGDAIQVNTDILQTVWHKDEDGDAISANGSQKGLVR